MIWFAALAAIVSVVSGLLILAMGLRKPAAVALYAGLTLVLFIAASEIAGTAKPIGTEWRNLKGLPIVGLYADDANKAVYVLVMRDGAPVSYKFPWPRTDQDAADLVTRYGKKGRTGEGFTVADDPGDIADVAVPPPQIPKEGSK